MTKPWMETWALCGLTGGSVGGFGDARGVPHQWVGGVVKAGSSSRESSTDPECIARMRLAAAAPDLYRAERPPRSRCNSPL